MRLARVVVWLALLACRKAGSGDPTRAFFEAKRGDFVASRDLFRGDSTLLTAVRKSPLGRIAGATSHTDSCGSALRGGELPWTCAKTGASVTTLADAERALGLPSGRLDEYGRVLPARLVSYAEGRMQFWLVDTEGAPGAGLRNVVWSDAPLPAGFDPLGDGFYADRR